MANAIELIKSDHRKVEQLHQRYQSTNGQTQQKQSIIQEICHELTVHAKLEEDIFYPAVERKLGKDGADLVKEALKEHNEMKRAISKLQASTFAGPECDRVFQEMMEGVQHHVKEEENEMLPEAQQQLGTESDRLGTQMQQRKQELQHTKSGSGSPEREVRLSE
jgi:hemerythrin superfamily protein